MRIPRRQNKRGKRTAEGGRRHEAGGKGSGNRVEEKDREIGSRKRVEKKDREKGR